MQILASAVKGGNKQFADTILIQIGPVDKVVDGSIYGDDRLAPSFKNTFTLQALLTCHEATLDFVSLQRWYWVHENAHEEQSPLIAVSVKINDQWPFGTREISEKPRGQ